MKHLLAVLLVVVAISAVSAHEDIFPYIVGGTGSGVSITGGQLTTGGHDDEAGTTTFATRVFGYDFGEVPSLPYNIGDPGFNNSNAEDLTIFPNNGVLTGGANLILNYSTPLYYWNGIGTVDFVLASTDSALRLGNSFAQATTISSTGASSSTLLIGPTNIATGRIHQHLMTALLFNGDSDLATLPNAPEGFYMLGGFLSLSNGSTAASDPFFIVYNNGLTEEVHDEALDWVQNNLAAPTAVPEPGTLISFGLTGLAFGLYAYRRPKPHA